MTAFNPDIAVKAMMPKEILAMASSLHLAIHLHKNFVQVMVFDHDASEILWTGHFPVEDHVDEWARATDFAVLKNWGDRVFRKVSISFDQPDFTLVPQGFILEGKESELLTFSTGKEPDHAEVQIFHELGVALIYDLPSEVQKIAERFPNARFHCSTGLFITECARLAKEGGQFFVLVQEGFMLVSAFYAGNMKLTNHFGIQGNDDVLYHISNAALRLNIHLESASVALFGSGANGELEELLGTYIGEVYRWSLPQGVKVNAEVTPHHYFSVLIHSTCA